MPFTIGNQKSDQAPANVCDTQIRKLKPMLRYEHHSTSKQNIRDDHMPDVRERRFHEDDFTDRRLNMPMFAEPTAEEFRQVIPGHVFMCPRNSFASFAPKSSAK